MSFCYRCVENCNTKMNPSSSFSVQGKCVSCNLYEKVQFQWSLFLEESGEFKVVENLDSMLITGEYKSRKSNRVNQFQEQLT